MIQTWLLSVQREITKDTVVEVAYNGNHSLRAADPRRLQPGSAESGRRQPSGVTRRARARFRASARLPGSIRPATITTTAFRSAWSIASAKGLYFLNSFTWGKAMGDSEQALEYYAGYVEANPQNIHDLAAEKGPSSFDVKFNNVTSVVYQLPFGKGRKFGSNMNPVLDGILGGWELNAINTAHTGTPLNVYYSAVDGQRRQRPFERISRRAVPAPQRIRQRGQPEHGADAEHLFRRLHLHHAACRTIPSAIWAATRSALRASSSGIWASTRTFASREGMKLAVPVGVLQCPEPHQLRHPGHADDTSAFGTIRTTYPSRQIQFALKLLF